jgi:hypothetical protein
MQQSCCITSLEILMETTQVQKLTLAEITQLVADLQARVLVLETPKPKVSGSPREMTADDARLVLTGEHKDLKHQAAADLLGLSYGQIYSCRLEFTFKAVHKEMKDAGIKNGWKK